MNNSLKHSRKNRQCCKASKMLTRKTNRRMKTITSKGRTAEKHSNSRNPSLMSALPSSKEQTKAFSKALFQHLILESEFNI